MLEPTIVSSSVKDSNVLISWNIRNSTYWRVKTAESEIEDKKLLTGTENEERIPLVGEYGIHSDESIF